jgi:ABC-type transport system involved in cytochrome c biogenesis permease subunit
MAIKYTIQGILIYTAIAAYLLAFIGQLLRLRRSSNVIFFLAFIISTASFLWRWVHTGHVPLQNLFELFIAMGAAVYLLSIICEKYLGINQRLIDSFIGVIILFPAGFVFSETPQQLPPALQSVFFVPHVAVYLFAYILMFKAAAAAVKTFKRIPEQLQNEDCAYRLVCFGFPLLTSGLVLGSIWAHYVWGCFWGFDPKEQWSLVTWLIYVGYFHFRFMFGRKYPRANSIWILSGFAAVLITLLWANLSRIFAGLHSYAI